MMSRFDQVQHPRFYFRIIGCIIDKNINFFVFT